ncbi:hypothetical protein EV146_12121 [Mesobacillus foraminis]|uniref:Uncharacterized protein n=1 Tax=Mesobacillus foraminis TaxID=279826 RepID=A0A4R2AWH5_9BACI|nr:hypothetical protein EV146_12121 [Mesobacillus foraminis]
MNFKANIQLAHRTSAIINVPQLPLDLHLVNTISYKGPERVPFFVSYRGPIWPQSEMWNLQL